MSNAKHTPGPWIVQNPDIFEDEEFKTDAVVGPFEGEQVALVYCDYNKDLANAHLIAAAPDLLEAAEILIEAFKADRVPINKVPHTANAIEFVRLAMLKAKGEL